MKRLFVFGTLSAALVIGLASGILIPGTGGQSDAGQYRGGARLSVDKDLIDFGVVRYDQFVEARFRLKNVGGQLLHLPSSPLIEVVEGC
jgi:hypothetical protein